MKPLQHFIDKVTTDLEDNVGKLRHERKAALYDAGEQSEELKKHHTCPAMPNHTS